VLKKFCLTEAEFDQIMQTPPRKHEEFETDTHLKNGYMRLLEKTAWLRNLVKGNK